MLALVTEKNKISFVESLDIWRVYPNRMPASYETYRQWMDLHCVRVEIHTACIVLSQKYSARCNYLIIPLLLIDRHFPARHALVSWQR